MANPNKMILYISALLLSVGLWTFMLWLINKSLNAGGPDLLIAGAIFLLLMLLFTAILLVSAYKCSNIRTLTLIWTVTIVAYFSVPISITVVDYQHAMRWHLKLDVWDRLDDESLTWEELKPLISELKDKTDETPEHIFQLLLMRQRIDLAKKMLDEKVVDITNTNLTDYLNNHYEYCRNSDLKVSDMDCTPVVAFLLDNGCCVDAIDYDGSTALIDAISQQDNKTVRLLIDRGADIKPRVGENFLLSVAAQNNNHEMLLLLLDKGADINYCDSSSGNALCAAACCCDVETARILLEHGADVNSANGSGKTALYQAVEGAKEELALLLLRHGADPTCIYSDSATLLSLIDEEGQPELWKLLHSRRKK